MKPLRLHGEGDCRAQRSKVEEERMEEFLEIILILMQTALLSAR